MQKILRSYVREMLKTATTSKIKVRREAAIRSLAAIVLARHVG
jgi:hypothetical protein